MSVARTEEVVRPKAAPLRLVATGATAERAPRPDHRNLQRTKGNQAVTALVQRRARDLDPEIPPPPPATEIAGHRAGADTGQGAVPTPPPPSPGPGSPAPQPRPAGGAARPASPPVPPAAAARLAPRPPARPAPPPPAAGLPTGLRTGGGRPGAGAGPDLGPPVPVSGGAAPAQLLAAAGAQAPARGGVAGRPTAEDRAALLAARPPGPHADPGFKAAKAKVTGVAKGQAAHPPVAAAVEAAHAAAVPPGNDLEAQAKEAKAADMGAAKVEPFDRQKFVNQVLAKVNELTPQQGDQVDEFKKDNRAGAIKDAVKGDVGPAAKQSAGDVKGQTDKPPDLSKATPKEVTPLEQPNVPAPPANVGAAAAMPAPLPPAATDLSAGPKQVESKMADAKVTDEQLKKGNEPKFDKAVESKTSLAEHAAKAPQEVRTDEQAKLAAAKAAAAAGSQAGLTAMHGAAQSKQADSHGKKQTAKEKDETKRKEVSDKINGVFEAAKTKVELILSNLDTAVNATFDKGAQQAATAFENDVEQRKEKIKSDMPWDEWVSSLVWEPSPRLKEAYVEGRNTYLERMRKVIGDVADVVDTHLRDAKQTIADAQTEIAKIVAEQPAHLRNVAKEAAAGLAEKFADLTKSVSDKQNEVVETVAGKYVEARKGIDDKIKEMEEADKGLLDMAMDDLNAVIDTILKLKEMLTSILSRAASAMDRIIADPIAFLQKLVGAVKAGFSGFGSRILEHLKTGFYEWILGPIKAMGVEVPTEWNLQSIFKLVLQVIGVTWEQIKGKIMAKLPPPVARILEVGIEAIGAFQRGGAGGLKDLAMDKLPPQVKSVIEMVNKIRTGGIAALWKIIGEKIGDLKRMVIDKIKDFLVEKVIKAGISWVLSLCNPAGAFVKAVELIIKIVSFFVDNAAKIKAVVDRILDSIEDILDGGGKVAGMIEETLAKFIPMVIEFIASLLGFGGIGAKVQEIIQSVRGTIDKAIDWLISMVMKGLKWIWEKMKAAAKKAKGKTGGSAQDGKPDDRSAGEKQKALDSGLEAASKLLNEKGATTPKVDQKLPAIKKQYALTELKVVEDPAGKIYVHGELNPKGNTPAVCPAPGTSAEGIGTTGLHGKKPSSNRKGDKIHWTESEHVLPFNIALSVRNALGFVVRKRGLLRGFDTKQTTLMIYYGAARIKTDSKDPSVTDVDNKISKKFKEELAASGLASNISAGSVWAQATNESPELSQAAVDAAVDEVFSVVSTVKDQAVIRTNNAIAAEHGAKEPGCAQTNGERRAEPAPVPEATKVSAAAETQYKNIVNLTKEAVANRTKGGIEEGRRAMVQQALKSWAVVKHAKAVVVQGPDGPLIHAHVVLRRIFASTTVDDLKQHVLKTIKFMPREIFLRASKDDLPKR